MSTTIGTTACILPTCSPYRVSSPPADTLPSHRCGELPAPRYLAVYEMEGDDLDALHSALSTAARRMEISAAFDRERTVTYTYRLITDGPAT